MRLKTTSIFSNINNFTNKGGLLMFVLFLSVQTIAQCPTVVISNQTFCDIQSPTIANLQAVDNGGGIAWYATATSTTPLSPSTGLVNGEDYFADNSTGNCGVRSAVVATIYGQPFGQNFQGVCVDNASDATLANLIAIGNDVKWYNSSVGGTPLPLSTVLTPNTIYYASQTNPNTGCETSRLSVFVSVGLVPIPSGNTVQTFCNDPLNPPTIANLNVSGNNNWYATISSALPLPLNTPLVNGQSYFAATVDPPCESTDRLEVLVTIEQPNNPGLDGIFQICDSEVASSLPVNLFNFLQGSPQNTGTWSGPLSTSNGFLGTVDITSITVAQSPYVFTYTVATATACPTVTATVTLTVSEIGFAGTNGSVDLCTTSIPVDLFTVLGGTPDTGGTWSPALASGTGLFNPAVDVAGVYTYTVTGIAPCPNQTATVTVALNPLPIAGTNGTALFCENSPSEDLFTYLGGTPNIGGTWSPALASGSGLFNPAVDAPGVYTYTVLGTPPCENQSATVTVTINPQLDPGTNGAVTLCNSSEPIDLFTVLGGSPNIGGTWSPALLSGTSEFVPGFDAPGVYTYTLPGSSICPDVSSTVTVTVNIEPSAGTNSSIVVCTNSALIDLYTQLGPNPDTGDQPDLGGVWVPPLSGGNGVFNPAVDPAGVYTYIVAGVAPCPDASATVTIIVNTPPDAGTNGTIDLCTTSIPVDLFTVLGGTPDTGGTWSPALASGTGLFNPAVDVAGVYTYTVTGIAPCPNQTATVTVALNPLPIAGTNGTAVFCESSPSEDLFTFLGGTPDAGGTWSPGLASGTGLFNPSVDTAGIYTYTVLGTLPCENQTATVTVTINLIPNAGTNSIVDLCTTSAPVDLFTVLGGTPDTGGTWSPALASGTGLFNPAVDAAGIYTYTILGIAPCPNQTATVTVTLNPLPIAGTNGTAVFCENSPSEDLFTFLGGTPDAGGTWSPALASGTGLFNPSVDAAGIYTYTVLGTLPCENQTATVTVTINLVPNAGTNGIVDLCTTSAPVDLFTVLGGTPDTGGTWSPALASGTGLFNPAVDAAGIYTYTILGITPCPNQTATVTVTLNPLPIAGTNGTAVFCENSPSEDLFTFLGGTPDAGGTWSPVLASGTGLFNPSVDAAGIYTYTVLGTLPCENQTATVTVTINLIPNAGTNGIVDLCTTSAPVDLFTVLGGTPDTGGTWSPALASGTGLFNPAVDAAGIYTYTILGIAPCPNQTATVTVIDGILPNAGLFPGIQNVCKDVTNLDLFSLLDGSQDSGGVWTNAVGTIVSNTVDASVLSLGINTFTYTVTNTCGVDFEEIQIEVVTSPIVLLNDLSIASPICQNEPVTVTINNLVDGTYTFVFSLSGSNLASGQSVTFDSLNGVATFEIIAALLPNAGTTIVTLDSIVEVSIGCTTFLTDFVLNLEILPLPTIESSTLLIDAICLGEDVLIQIEGATNLTDGFYDFSWNIPNAIPSTGTTGLIEIIGGVGQIELPGSQFATSGLYTITINSISSQLNGCVNFNEDAVVTFQILPLPSMNEAQVSIEGDICINSEGVITISGASNLSDGTYDLNYVLSGVVSFTNTITVEFIAGVANFTIPATQLNLEGIYVLTIEELLSQTPYLCGTSGNSFATLTFELETVLTPQLIENGNSFCEDDNPTVDDLSANVVGGTTTIWYDAPVNGTILNPNETLVNGTVYYGSQLESSGCESTIRLEVTVLVVNCNELVIPDGFSPNGDGINDNFVIKNIRDLYPQFTLEVFNRYGTVLYTGDISSPDWDGTAQKGVVIGDSNLPTGVYFFIINFNDGVRKPHQGRVYLSR